MKALVIATLAALLLAPPGAATPKSVSTSIEVCFKKHGQAVLHPSYLKKGTTGVAYFTKVHSTLGKWISWNVGQSAGKPFVTWTFNLPAAKVKAHPCVKPYWARTG